MSRTSLIVALLALGACKRTAGPGASCDAVGAHFISTAESELATAKLDAELAGGVKDLLPPIRDGMVRACKEGAWGPAARDCFAGAADGKAMKGCYAQLDTAQRTALDRAAAGKSDEDDAP
ncbi:MAG: hypothetical protein K8W52_17440 [Deltaproteobacteria bacterium]|nr:hypothetical protein [Deltaproteobacteria bacterium]